jgi:transposase-like protein
MTVAQPQAGVHYPRSTGEFQSWFARDEDCLDYLAWLRWPDGFVCPGCESLGGWRLADGSFRCVECRAQSAVTAGTLFDRRRTPLTVWFAACWMFASQKDGVSALSLQRALEIGSYPTAWAMLHRLRSVLVRPSRERLTGTVEVDEAFFGGEEPGLRGGRAKGKKALVAVAVERKQPRGYGRSRMTIVPDASADSLHAFVSENVEPGATVITDGWPSYRGIERLGYIHEPHSQRTAAGREQDVGSLLPGVHRVASLAKRWMLGTHQGSIGAPHLQSYLNEFVFRFNRRRSRSRGLVFYRVLQLAVDHDPVRYRQLVADSKPKKAPPTPPRSRGHPPSLDRPRSNRPWRAGY